jgi:hypothetical protein
VQVAAIQAVEQVRQPLRVGTKLVRRELQVQRVVGRRALDRPLQQVGQLLDFEQRTLEADEA